MKRSYRRGAPSASSKGQSMVEFALVAPLILLLVFGIVDMGRVFFAKMTLQNAVLQAARYAVTGNHEANDSGLMSRVSSIQHVAAGAAMGLDISQISISSAIGGAGNAGGPGDMITISVAADVHLLTPMIAQFFPHGVYHFTVSTTMKNEPFAPGSTL